MQIVRFLLKNQVLTKIKMSPQKADKKLNYLI